MQLQRLLSFARKAVDEYTMIQEGDHIAVGISGGKDSLTLLCALHGLKRFYPQKFELSAVTVDLGFDDFDLTPIKDLCHDMEIPYQIVKSDIYHILFDIRKESNPCSLCAKMRKGALNQAVKEMGCNKVAYAHHKDDIVETMLLSMIFEGRFYSFSPKTWLDRMDLTVIRPLMFVDEMDVIGFKNKYNLPVVKSKCLLFVSIELAQLAICIPFSILRLWTLPEGNPVGIEANAAYFGFGLIVYAIFNFLYLTVLFRSAYQVGKAFVIAILPATAVIALMEYAVHLPSFAWLDSVQRADVPRQLPVLAAGVLIYVGGNLLTYKAASKQFERVDL